MPRKPNIKPRDMTVIRKIRNARVTKYKTIKEFCKKIGITVPQYYYYYYRYPEQFR